MKVLQINAVSGIRSTGRICTEIENHLKKAGDDGYIAYSDGAPSSNGYKIGSKVEIKLHGLFSRIFGLQGYFSKRGTKKLLKYIEKLDPEIIHLHNLHSNYVNLEILFEYIISKDIPTVLTLHDCWFYTGKCTHYTEDQCYKWRTGCEKCPRLRKDNPSWFFDRTQKMYLDKKEWFKDIPRLSVVGVSDWITNEAELSILSKSKMIKRIYNWVDLDIFRPVDTTELKEKMKLDNHFVILGVSSNWSNVKGLDTFIELAKVISDEMKIVLIGNMEKSMQLPDNIISIKETHDVYALVEYYSMADVLVNLSLEESFGKVTAEAMACGTPAIAINSTANPELIGEKCGYILEDKGLDLLLESIEKIKTMGKEFHSSYCIKYAQEKFNIEKNIDAYLDVYKKTVEM